MTRSVPLMLTAEPIGVGAYLGHKMLLNGELLADLDQQQAA